MCPYTLYNNNMYTSVSVCGRVQFFLQSTMKIVEIQFGPAEVGAAIQHVSFYACQDTLKVSITFPCVSYDMNISFTAHYQKCMPMEMLMANQTLRMCLPVMLLGSRKKNGTVVCLNTLWV